MSNNQDKLNEQLFNVIASGKDSNEAKLKKIKYLVYLGADVNAKDENGNTPLIQATYNGHLEVVKCLVQNGADMDVKNKRGRTALMMAVGCGNLELCSYLIENGADVNVRKFDGGTALMEAVSGGNEDIVFCLVEGGADVKVRDNDKESAFMKAARRGQIEVVKCLVQNGADVNEQDLLVRLQKFGVLRHHVAVGQVVVFGEHALKIRKKLTRFQILLAVPAVHAGDLFDRVNGGNIAHAVKLRREVAQRVLADTAASVDNNGQFILALHEKTSQYKCFDGFDGKSFVA